MDLYNLNRRHEYHRITVARYYKRLLVRFGEKALLRRLKGTLLKRIVWAEHNIDTIRRRLDRLDRLR